MTIEPMTQEEFVRDKGKCPACYSLVDPQETIRKVCPGCGAQWHIQYAPKRIIGYVMAHTLRRYL